MWTRGLPTLVLLLVALLALCGCVANERRGATKARDEYRACFDEHPQDPARCDALKARYDAEVQRYEEHSRRAWSCDPAQEECPTPR